ncbi:MAG: 16S rRNA (uracil(1498)-N(3))-methyltransferase [Clostridia bacterium]|nr:16S rRNA (uracil(1498)-N(3))-methyltransferase [Clostridia bacterium]
MPRFFIESGNIRSEENGDRFVTLEGKDAHHASRVLRLRPGEEVTLCDENSWEYDSVVETAGEAVILRVTDAKAGHREPPYRATVYQALAKGDRFDTVVQKSVEMGACEIVPVVTARCTVKIDAKDAPKKVARWQRIAYEAAKQCGRGVIPSVRHPMQFADAIKEASKASVGLFCYEGDGTVPIPKILEVPEPETVSVFVGPEGGFDDREAAEANAAGMQMCGLGRRILRTETAAHFALACLSYQFELKQR